MKSLPERIMSGWKRSWTDVLGSKQRRTLHGRWTSRPAMDVFTFRDELEAEYEDSRAHRSSTVE